MGVDSRRYHHVTRFGHAYRRLGCHTEWLGYLLCVVVIRIRHWCW